MISYIYAAAMVLQKGEVSALELHIVNAKSNDEAEAQVFRYIKDNGVALESLVITNIEVSIWQG